MSAKGRYRGDSGRVRQVLYNLFSNAVKFTHEGAIAFTVSRDGGAITFRVDDTGVGIAPENLERLFDSFFQADASNTRRYAGAGLGLTICQRTGDPDGRPHRRRERAWRRLDLHRHPSAGAHRRRAAAGAGRRRGGRCGRASLGTIRVLAAEDNDVNQLVLKTLLSQAGINPTMVADGAMAVAAWERETWDIILMDIQMPEMDGVQATREIRRREAETGRARTPILAVTANAMVHQVAAYQAAGMDGVVLQAHRARPSVRARWRRRLPPRGRRDGIARRELRARHRPPTARTKLRQSFIRTSPIRPKRSAATTEAHPATIK